MATTTDTREQFHALIEHLGPEQLKAVHGLLEVMLVDDEPLTEEEEEALDRAEEWLKHNEAIPHEEVLAEFGLTLDDFPLNKNGA